MTWTEHYNKWIKCTRCELHRSRTHAVLGMGRMTHGNKPGAPLFVMGQFPGNDEDEIGLPMQGIGGQWVHWAITKVLGIGWDECFFTNVLACKPITSSVRKAWSEVCKPRVWECLEIVKPKLIISMGLEASKFITGDRGAKMGFMAGTRGIYRGFPVAFTTHPFEPARQKTASGKKDSEAKVIRDFQLVKGYAVELNIIGRDPE